MKRAAQAFLAFVVTFSVRLPALGCSFASWNPNDVVENPRFDSIDKAFTVVVREEPRVGDFETTTAGALAGMTPPFESDDEEYAEEDFVQLEDFEPYVPVDPLLAMGPGPWDAPESAEDEEEEELPLEAVLYRNRKDGVRERVARFTLEEQRLPDRLMVSDDGEFVVSVSGPYGVMTGCGGPLGREGIVIYDTGTGAHRRLEFKEILTASDLRWSSWGYLNDTTWTLRIMPNTGHMALTATLPPVRKVELPTELDIDLASGSRVQPLADIYPPLTRITVSAAPGIEVPSSDACAALDELAILDAYDFLERAVDTPSPEYPEVAFRAGVRGKVIVAVVVDGAGRVSCMRVVKRLPFGLTEAATKALADWRFSPVVVDGKRAEYAGVVQFDFAIGKPE